MLGQLGSAQHAAACVPRSEGAHGVVFAPPPPAEHEQYPVFAMHAIAPPSSASLEVEVSTVEVVSLDASGDASLDDDDPPSLEHASARDAKTTQTQRAMRRTNRR